MPVFETRDGVSAGLPLGGIGAGKLELTAQGLFNAISFQNNWSKPIERPVGAISYPGILGYHLGFFIEAGGFKKAFLLQTAPLGKIPRTKNIRYVSDFPKTELFYETGYPGVQISLEAFSSWKLGDAKRSGLPCVFFNFKVKNLSRSPVKTGFLFIGRNTVGEWTVGRQNRIHEKKDTVDLEFFRRDAVKNDSQNGQLLFSFLRKGWALSFIESWNAVTKNFSFTPDNINLAAWPFFAHNGSLPNIKSEGAASGENRELCGAVSAFSSLDGQEEKTFSFNASWYFPNNRFGHRYQGWFSGAKAVADYAWKQRSDISQKNMDFHRLAQELPFPGWFRDALLTSFAPFFASSWHTRDGRFAFYEAPQVCPLMGTLDVGFYGSIPLSYFFPELSISQMLQFAKAQRRNGYIPHDLGKERLDLPSDGTTFFEWKDLNPKFILMAYRDYLWSGNKAFLRQIYPHVKRALEWSLKQDKNMDRLPDHEGQDQTFDLWPMEGVNSYTAGIFLAAVLACEKMALAQNDRNFARQSREIFSQARHHFEKDLWNGLFFGKKECMLAQLNGQWYANLLDLGPIADPTKIQRAVRFIFKHHFSHSQFGLVNAINPNLSLDTSNDHAKNIWPGMNYAFISLALNQGLPLKNLLKAAAGVWDNVCRLQKSPWNQADTIDSKTGCYIFGDYYYRNMAIWSIPIMLAKKNKKLAVILRKLRKP